MILFRFIFVVVRAAFRNRTDLALENIALRQQLAVLRRSLKWRSRTRFSGGTGASRPAPLQAQDRDEGLAQDLNVYSSFKATSRWVAERECSALRVGFASLAARQTDCACARATGRPLKTLNVTVRSPAAPSEREPASPPL